MIGRRLVWGRSLRKKQCPGWMEIGHGPDVIGAEELQWVWWHQGRSGKGWGTLTQHPGGPSSLATLHKLGLEVGRPWTVPHQHVPPPSGATKVGKTLLSFLYPSRAFKIQPHVKNRHGV